MPSLLPGVIHPLVPGGEDMAAPQGHITPPWNSLPSEAPNGVSPAPLPSEAPASPEATAALGASGENPGVVEGDLRSIYEEIEALGLTPVTQGEDDPLPAGLDLGDLTPAPFSPCSLPLTIVSPPTSEEPLDCSTNPAADGTPLMASKPAEAMASATRPGPEPPGAPLVGVEQSTSFPVRGPTEDSPPPDAVAAKPTIEPAPGIGENPLPNPQTLEPDREVPLPSYLASGAQNLTFAPAPATDANPVPIPSTSPDVIAVPGLSPSPFQ
ncbi:hypothetical protein UY3_15435 [Chelonia mydas]|uniref:Uncharacterized protein n=1 Tax=Chelonia mydas TaxID=8469 RepID=M7AWQ0_CHEMY|nr:hypothetical protein UY3_15435 [Chelonia mydas]